MPTPTYTPLATVTLGSTATSVTFSSIPATYRDLIVVHSGLLTSGGQEIRLRYNGDSGNNYIYVEMSGTGSSATSSTATLSYAYGGLVYTTAANSIVQIMDYSATDKHKTGLTRSNNPANNVVAFAHRWANTAAITSLELSIGGNLWAAGATFNLYGVIA
jgi:hypothetical protein